MQSSRYEIFHDVLAAAIADWRGRVDAERRAQVNNFLRPLHRWAWTLSSRYWAASLAIAGALLMAIVQDPDSSQWNVPNWIVGSIMFGGLLLMTATVVASARRYGRIVAAIQCGFSWSVIADTIADRRGDIGDLQEGTGRYDKVAAPVRDRLRARRRVQAAIMLLAAVVPLAGIIAVVTLGARDVIEPDAAPDIVAVPSMVLLGVFAVLGVMNVYALWKAHRSSARAIGASPEWRRSSHDYFEGIGPGQASAAAVRRARQAGWVWRLALLALLAGTALAAIPIMLATVVGSILLEIAVPNWSRFDDQMRLRDAAMRERTDPAVSPIAAGRAFYSLTEAGRTLTPGADDLPVPRVLPPPWDPKDDENPFGADVTAVFETLLTRAGAGLTGSQRQYLERIAGFPGLSEAAVVARAPFVDYLGARLRPDNRVMSQLYPIPSLQSLRSLTRVYLAKAALELAGGRPDEAVATMQELISLSLVVIDDAHTLIQALIGRSMLDSGLKGLEQLYAATGNEERAQAIRLRREGATTVTDLPDPSAPTPIVNLARTREGMFDRATSTRRLRAARWEALSMISYFPCANAQELIFGPTDAYEAAFERARATLVRFPSEQRFLDNIRLTVELSGEAAVSAEGTGLLNRAAQFMGRLFSSERILGCAVALV